MYEYQDTKEDFIRNEYRRWFMGKDLDYSQTSLFRELMERVYHPDNLDKFENDL